MAYGVQQVLRPKQAACRTYRRLKQVILASVMIQIRVQIHEVVLGYVHNEERYGLFDFQPLQHLLS